jgi:hypothetical protein
MAGNMMENLPKMLKKTMPYGILLIILVALYVYSYDRRGRFSFDAFDSQTSPTPIAPLSTTTAAPVASAPSDASSFNVNDFLPTKTSDMPGFDTMNPTNGDSNVIGADLLNAQAFMGQVSQYKGIMNLDIRAQPVIEKREVSPWMQSSFEQAQINTGIQISH